ncbi:thioredoxin family protein [uncultured Ferrimonas sp.]|uniref:thioredoxin family protein n=1 Tax=uncultured Ferrimonas sp. TaxID=432640 RepID=UPI0034441A7E
MALAALLAPMLFTPAQAEGGCGFEQAGKQQGLIATCDQDTEKKEVILTGLLGPADLAQQPHFAENLAAYQADAAVISKLQQIDVPTEIIVIMATWCPDCHRETPRLAKVIEQMNNPNIKVTYIGVDREKKDADGLAAKYDFTRIPTYIVQQGEMELGRIVESTKYSTELDLLDILHK